jgi:hypothetical protein
MLPFYMATLATQKGSKMTIFCCWASPCPARDHRCCRKRKTTAETAKKMARIKEIQELHRVCCSRGSPLLRDEIGSEVL